MKWLIKRWFEKIFCIASNTCRIFIWACSYIYILWCILKIKNTKFYLSNCNYVKYVALSFFLRYTRTTLRHIALWNVIYTFLYNVNNYLCLNLKSCQLHVALKSFIWSGLCVIRISILIICFYRWSVRFKSSSDWSFHC